MNKPLQSRQTAGGISVFIFLNEQQVANVMDNGRPLRSSEPTLLGFQMANGPDIHEWHGNKPTPHQVPEYMADLGIFSSNGDNARDNAAVPMPPQTASSLTTPSRLSKTSGMLTHQRCWKGIHQPYLMVKEGDDSDPNLSLIVLETHTASCGGLACASGLLAAVLYLTDPALQGASIGMSQILLLNRGVGQTNHLFTTPPNNMSTFPSIDDHTSRTTPP
ncbi:hypothetical protein FS837_004933 [Tulasnella sp. UAMH 9824]|nr:hypothetical protein FS837_004933 [Tulasnella sp. UAMH 9824]